MMALTIGGGGGGGGGGARTLQGGSTYGNSRRPILFPPSSSNPFRGSLHFTARNVNIVAKAAKKLSSRTGKFDSKNRRSLSTTTKEEEKEQRTVPIETDDISGRRESVDINDVVGDDGYFLPELPGDKPDPFEGSQWDVLGFVVQYLWAFGIVFALIACGIAVATYNEGATDFKQTPAYKESIQSRELLEEPEGSSSDVFESNPTEEAPSLE